jgi:hypothetical protein
MRIFAKLHLEQERGRAENRAMIDTPARLLGIG